MEGGYCARHGCEAGVRVRRGHGADGLGRYVYDLATGGTRFVTSGTIESWIDNDHILVS
jgi:hypothetical protein